MLVKKFRAYYILLAVLILIYLAELLLIPPNEAALTRFGVSVTTAKVLSATFAVPLFTIWYAAFYGFIKVKQYALLATDTKDGRAFDIVGNGLMVLALSLPITSLLSSARTYVGNHNPDMVPTLTILFNYLVLGMSLLALWLVSLGAKRLIATLKKKPYSIYQAGLAALFTAFCFVYAYAAMQDVAGTVLGRPAGSAAFYLPDFLIFSTIVIPYILLWYLGFRAAYHIKLYSAHVPGVLYRKSLNLLASGVAAVVVALMVLRVLASLSSFLNSLSLKYLLALVYALLIMIGIGYGLIALGAKKLKKIEEV